jgi:Mn-containing catalase
MDSATVAESSPAKSPEGLDELLMDELRDILHAEKQLTKALPQMAEAARFDQLRDLLELHLGETEAQIERLNECFQLLGKTARGQTLQGDDGPCRGRPNGD